MITAINLFGAPCFATPDSTLGNLGLINFIYGPNGSGKTTISRLLKDHSLFPGATVDYTSSNTPPKVMVYNRDYVTSTITECAGLAGVFTLNEDPEARKELDTLTQEGGPRATLEATLALAKQKKESANATLTEARTKLSDRAWNKKSDIANTLQDMFAGYNHSKEKLLEELLRTDISDPLPTLDHLTQRAGAVFVKSAHEHNLLQRIEANPILTLPGYPLLTASISGSQESPLKELIDRLDNSDWVNAGQAFIGNDASRCPFCQQNLPDGFASELAKLFDTHFEQQLSQLKVLQQSFIAWATETRRRLDEANDVGTSFISTEQLSTFTAKLKSTLVACEHSINQKLSTPSIPVTLDDLTGLIGEVNTLIEAANTRIRQHNDDLAQRASKHKTLVAQCWSYFAGTVMNTDLQEFRRIEKRCDATLKEATTDEKTASHDLATLDAHIRELETAVHSSAPTIDRMNQILAGVGFSSFNISKSQQVPDGYALMRPDGTTAGETLSDGERTFVALLYFLAQAQSASEQPTGEDVILVIDDPISSLDSDVLFVVTQLIKDMIQTQSTADARGKKNREFLRDRLRQAIILTHNIHFWSQLTFLTGEEKRNGQEANRKYYELRKIGSGVCSVRLLPRNTIRSLYTRLWSEVAQTDASDTETDIGLENAMRRILESYFKLQAGISFDGLLKEFTGPNRLICQSLFGWLNHGSHLVMDELEFSPRGTTTAMYLRVFKEIFDKTGQIGHYNLMMSQVLGDSNDAT